MKDPARLARWADELDGLVDVPDGLKIYRTSLIGDLRSELFRLIRDEREPKAVRRPGPETS